MLIINTTRDTVIAYKAEVADSLIMRLVGLLGRREFNRGEALIFYNTSSVHTIGMCFKIDVLFINKNNVVIGAVVEMRPFRLSRLYPFCNVIELPAGIIKESNTQKGDVIQIKSV
jgi:uncharacterized membrane protein (UPF0127 family)